MIKFLRMFEKSVIFVVKAGLFLILFATFYGLFSIVAPQLLRPSRTMFITLTTYLLAALLFLRIYGGIPLGIKKSKDIIASVALASFFTDIVAFVELVVMSEFKIIFDFYMLFIVFFIQLLLVIVGTYFGNWLFFKLHDPEKSILVYADEDAAREFLSKVRRYRKQWDVDFSLSYETENLYKRLFR